MGPIPVSIKLTYSIPFAKNEVLAKLMPPREDPSIVGMTMLQAFPSLPTVRHDFMIPDDVVTLI